MYYLLKIVIVVALMFLCNFGINAQQNIDRMTDNAHILFKSQKYKDAAKAFNDVLNENSRLQAINSEDTLLPIQLFDVYNEYAECYKVFGDYRKAKELYLILYDITYRSINRQKLWDVFRINLADCYLYTGEYEKAKELINNIQTTDYLEKKAIYKSNIQFRQGKLREAKNTLDSLISHMKNSPLYPIALQNRGYICWQIDSLQEFAYSDLSTALSLISSKDDAYYWTLSNMAIFQAKRGESCDAIKNIEKCVEYFKDKSKKNLLTDYVIVLRKKAEIFLIIHNFSESVKAFKRYYEFEKIFLVENFTSMSEQQRLDFWKKEKPLVSEIFALEREDPVFLYDVALFRRQVALLGRKDSLTISQKLSYTKNMIAKNLGKKDIAIEFIKYEKDKKNRYAALLLAGSDKKQVKFIPLWLEDSIKAYNVGGNRLDLALCSTIKEDKDRVYQNESLSSFVWDKLLPFIPEGSTVYFAPDGILHLLAIEYLPTVNNGKYELHRLTTTALLAEQKNKRKKQKTNSLVIGGMDYDFIPLLDNETSAIANKDAFEYLLQNNKLMNFTYLPGSKAETDTIVNFLSHIDGFEDMDESLLKDRMGRYNIVHLATHGYSWYVDVPSLPYAYRDSITEDKSLLASGIAISGANRLYLYPHRDDGLLSARELCEMDLTSVELVVASACQSAQGRVSDEGPIGLVRGLKKAGVKTIIASLWPVNDNSTTLLMLFFYDEWREGKGKNGNGCSKAHALHLAQERLRNVEGPPARIRTYNSSTKTGRYKTAATATYDSPYYWAPFIIIDDI